MGMGQFSAFQRKQPIHTETSITGNWCCHIIYVYVIARAGVIFGIYFTSCRYSGG